MNAFDKERLARIERKLDELKEFKVSATIKGGDIFSNVMKNPTLIITTITEKSSDIIPDMTIGYHTIPGHIHFTYEIGVVGSGDLSYYLKEDKTFNKDKLATDILNGKINIVGT